MNTIRSAALALAVITVTAYSTRAGERATPVRPNAGFEWMKGLVGTWEAKTKDGVASVRYDIISEGTAIMETMSYPGGEAAMVTVYHPDGDHLLMTHYCGANNQPRMRCAGPSADGGSMTFEFVDCSNLPTPETGHMHGLVITRVDADHIAQKWTWMEKGKASEESYQYERKKS